MKKTIQILLVVLIGLAVLIAVGLFLFKDRKKETEPVEQEGTYIETILDERPYITLTPRSDGREFTLEISRIKNAGKIEYELVYLSKGLSRGAIGSMNYGGESKLTKKILLGTCSKNVCKYDEDVSEGTLTVKFRSEEGVRKFVSDFHLQQGDSVLTSIDKKFQVKGRFSDRAFYLTMATVGLPGEAEGEVLSEPYGAFTSGSESVSQGQVSLSLEAENPSARLLAWNGQDWEEMEAEAENVFLTAAAESLGTFIAVASTE